ncbi:MAG TPA: hypothetical protein VMZ28_11610 [Kofleriaceae bacterium]|nr:hypothetical protein [Kofleriaceae bacterium]
MTQEIEKLSEGEFQRSLERGPVGRSPAKQAAGGGLLAAGSVGVIAAFPGLAALVLAPLYVTAGLGVLVVAHAGVTWWRQRRQSRQHPPVPPARALPPGQG